MCWLGLGQDVKHEHNIRDVCEVHIYINGCGLALLKSVSEYVSTDGCIGSALLRNALCGDMHDRHAVRICIYIYIYMYFFLTLSCF